MNYIKGKKRNIKDNRRPRTNSNNSSKIVKYKKYKPLHLNIGMIIFGFIFVYIIFVVLAFFSAEHIVGYEVVSGSLSETSVYEGIALREERTVSANHTGYVNYFAREGEHVGVGNLVYTTDESGRIAELIDTDDESIKLDNNDLLELKTTMVNYQKRYDSMEFSSLYDFSYELKGVALKLSNYNMLNNVDKISTGSGLVNFGNAMQSGVITYYVDGYENLTLDDITKEHFDKSKYEKTQMISNQLLSTDDVVYKLSTNEKWSIVIQTTQEKAREFLEEEYVKVKFLKNQVTSYGRVDTIQKGEDTFVCLTFTNSMINFVTDRFIDVEILSNQGTGLKIPNSAIVEKEFYLVPKEYIIVGGTNGASGFLREKYLEDGSQVIDFVDVDIYAETDSDYYINTNSLKVGEYICMENSASKYPVSKVGTLIGVYNMDKGYADFKQITILYANEEYSIVKSNTQYGLSVYDHIVLEAASVNEDDFLQ